MSVASTSKLALLAAARRNTVLTPVRTYRQYNIISGMPREHISWAEKFGHLAFISFFGFMLIPGWWFKTNLRYKSGGFWEDEEE